MRDLLRDHSWEKHLVGTAMSSVAGKSVDWLWPGYIPCGHLTILDGDPGLGKSLVTLALAAAVANGGQLPCGTFKAPHGGVILLSAEDSLSTTVQPRLLALHADMERIIMVRHVERRAVSGRTIARPVRLPDDVDALALAVQQMHAKLVVIDPLTAYMSATRDQDVRAALGPLADLAQRANAAVVLIRHLTKRSDANALYRGGGSIGIIAVARAGLLVARHPESPVSERVLIPTKNNLDIPGPALSFRVISDEGYETAGGENRDESERSQPDAPRHSVRARIEWLGACELTLTQILRPPANALLPTAETEAIAFLREALRETARPAVEVEREARTAAISSSALRRAREKLGVYSVRRGYGANGYWSWALPTQPDTASSVGTAAKKTEPDSDRTLP